MNKTVQAFLTVISLGILLLFSGYAQAKDTLQTIETQHARIHFHQDYQAFAQQVAKKFESIYADVSQRVGFDQNDKLDFLIGDDNHQANGYAIPLTAGKIIKVFTSAPRSEEALGSYDNWLDLVISHELTHKIHMSQPSRSWRSSLDSVLLSSDALNFNRYPRWITEGYATVIETEYTKQGRVNSDYIKAMLQQWAIDGQLPSYNALNGSNNYEGNRMAYYQGSAFLFWLQENHGQEKLQQLWKRTTAKKYRSFDDAFLGLFLESPQRLYKKFVAAQTFSAMQGHILISANSRGKLWQNNFFKVSSNEPSMTHDKILQLEIDSEGYAQLKVLSLDENIKAQDNFIERNKQLLSEDKLDVPDTMPEIFNREALHVVTPSKSLRWRHARWLDDKNALVLQAQRQDNNELGFELAKVELSTGKVEKVTESLRIHDFTLTQDKKSVIAMSHFAGFNQLLKISLVNGSFIVLDEKRLSQPMDNLTLSPDGETLALMAIHDKQWKIHFYHLGNKQWQVVELPIEGNYTSHLRWQTDGLYFSQSHRSNVKSTVKGIKNNTAIDVYRLNLTQRTWQQLTSGQKLATHGFTINDQLIYLSTSNQGQDTYSNSFSGVTDDQYLSKGSFELLSIDKAVPKVGSSTDLPSIDYGVGPQTGLMTLITGYSSVDDSGLDFVIRGGDPLGRLRWQAAITSGNEQGHSAISVKSNWKNIEWFAEYVNREYKNDFFTEKNQLVNFDLAKIFTLSDHSSLKVQFGVGNDEVDYVQETLLAQTHDEINHYRLQGQFGYNNQLGKVNYGVSLNTAFVDYKSDYQTKHTWQRHDYGLGFYVSNNDYKINYHYLDSEVDDNTPLHSLLTYGGQLTTTTSQVLNSHKIDSRVPLVWQSGLHFQQHNIEVESEGFTFFYLQNKADDKDALAAYGAEFNILMDGNMTPLLDGLTLQAGFTWYEERRAINDMEGNGTQLYLSVTYQFK
jgi:hypothetical protein